MKLIDGLKKLESHLERLFDGSPAPSSEDSPDESGKAEQGRTGGQGGARGRPPLEMKREVVRQIEAAVVRIDGLPAFPFTRIDVDLVCRDAQHRALIEAELLDGQRLETAIHGALEAARVQARPRPEVFVHLLHPEQARTRELLERGVRLECTREEATQPLGKSGRDTRAERQQSAQSGPCLVLQVGQASPDRVSLTKNRVNLGRLSEVHDRAGRVLRRNQLVFEDIPGVNASVSRMHAHVEFDAEARVYRLYDDGSAEGTVLMREGRRIVVPSGKRRGVALTDGDEIGLGQAVVRFEG